MVKQYTSNVQGYRSTVIARTESLRSMNSGSLDQYRDQLGQMDGLSGVKWWRTAADARASYPHRIAPGAKKNQRIALDADFSVDGKNIQAPLARQNCRCQAHVDIVIEKPTPTPT